MEVLFVIVPIVMVGIIVLGIIMTFSPKMRGRMLKRQIRATRSMLDEVKDDLTDMSTTMAGVGIKTRENILNAHEDSLRNMATKEANISKEGIEITARAIKDGLVGEKVYCKHCGSLIDKDSKFCKSCGGQQ